MNNKTKEIRDPKTNRLFGIYHQEDNILEIKQKGRTMRIHLLSDSIKTSFADSKPEG